MDFDANIQWVKDMWAKYNRQVLTFIETALVVGAIAACDVLLNMLSGGNLPTDSQAVLVIIGSTFLSAIIQFIRAKLPSDLINKNKDV